MTGRGFLYTGYIGWDTVNDMPRGSNNTVVVTNSGSSFSPTVSTTLGIPYIGTGASGAMRSQFQSVYGMALADSAIIRFGSTGNNDVGVMRLADGSVIKPNTDYTLARFDQVSSGPWCTWAP